MKYVELNRDFVPVEKDKEPILDSGMWGLWGRKYAGWKSWPDLLQYRRVLLLAEASSGKSVEFRHQQEALVADGKPAFFIRIEELADQGFEAALEPGDAGRFKAWLQSNDEGFFFLDSVDEARLNKKSLETALKRFARDLDKAVERASVYISCRVSDWHGEKDRLLIQRLLPSFETPAVPSPTTGDPLLDPIFKRDEPNSVKIEKEPERKRHDVLVVQLVPLNSEQCEKLAKACDVNDAKAFMNGIHSAGLDVFTERPGDVVEHATYWKKHGRFEALNVMMEFGIAKKFAEEEAHRPDNAAITPDQLRSGAESVAAALTLMKTFTVRAPGHDPDPSLPSGALETDLLLTNITSAQREALLRRGIFSPATYGRVRFHHRTTQEYLTACWMGRLLDGNCPIEEIRELIFTERYGVPTTVPSLRPAAAWLALKRQDILEEMITRDPVVLMRNGDPRSLSLDARKRILLSFAKMHAEARVADDSMDNRAIALFSVPELADTILAAWKLNTRDDFRLDLLRMIREGKISGCVTLLRKIVADQKTTDYNRIVALQALAACEDVEGLKKAAVLLKKDKAASVRVKSNFARTLFPKHISVAELTALIDENPADKRVTEGFDYASRELYESCSDATMRAEFASRLAELCLTPPFKEPYHRVAKKHSALAKQLHKIATSEVKALGDSRVADHVVRLLMVVERSDRDYTPDDEPHLRDLLKKNLPLKRALFWADVEEQRRNGREEGQTVTHIWHVFIHGQPLWSLGPDDLEGFYNDLMERDREDDKRVAVSTIWAILRDSKSLDAGISRLREAIGGSEILVADLEGFLAPPKISKEMREHERRRAKRDKERLKQEKADKKSWKDFSKNLKADPSVLSDKKTIADWKKGAYRLVTLSRWLRRRTGKESDAPLQWRLLAEGFGQAVAEGYRDGMKAFWRLSKPERPKRGEGSGVTVKHTTILAHQAVGIEAAEDREWAEKLTEQEAKIALGHATISEQGVPDWIYDLLDAHPKLATAAIRRELKAEWSNETRWRSDFLYHFARGTDALHPAIEPVLIKVLSEGKQPDDINKLDTGLRIVSKLSLSAKQAEIFSKLARKRVAQAEAEVAMRNLALLLIVEGDTAIQDMKAWLAQLKGPERRKRAEALFAYLFDRHDPVATSALKKISVAGLEALLRLVYHHIRPEEDNVHEASSFTPNVRDHAESARNAVLNAIIERPGPEAFHALQMMANDPDYKSRRTRFQEIARGKADNDSEFPAWTAPEVVTFEKEHTAPVKTGEDLLRVVMAVLSDIQIHLDKADVSSRALLERAKDEDEVRNYVVEQMKFRSRKRFHAYREAQVADRDRPDIIVASTSAPVEVGMEVKHGSKTWTHKQLTNALDTQLAEDYLKPSTRRHGVFVVTKHSARRWRDAETKVMHTFESIIGWLQDRAAKLIKNSTGAITVRCFGLDATDKKKPSKRK